MDRAKLPSQFFRANAKGAEVWDRLGRLREALSVRRDGAPLSSADYLFLSLVVGLVADRLATKHQAQAHGATQQLRTAVQPDIGDTLVVGPLQAASRLVLHEDVPSARKTTTQALSEGENAEWVLAQMVAELVEATLALEPLDLFGLDPDLVAEASGINWVVVEAAEKKEEADSLLDSEGDLLDAEAGFQPDVAGGTEIAAVAPDASVLQAAGAVPLAGVAGGGGGGGVVTPTADVGGGTVSSGGGATGGGGGGFAGGGGGGGASGGGSSAGFGGRVVDGYVVGATVFYDEDNDGIFDEGERSTITDANGLFSFSATDSAYIGARPGGKVVILPGGIDSNTGQPVGMLTSELGQAGKIAISSPLTLILSRYPEIDETDFTAQLGISGLPDQLLYYDPVLQMENASGNPELAERVFTIQQQVFSIIQSANVVAGKTVGVAGLDAAVQAVGDAVVSALASGTALTLEGLAQEAITTVTQQVGLSDRAASIVTAINLVNEKIGQAYAGLAEALSNRSDAQEAEEAIQTLSAAKAAAAASQEILLRAIEEALASDGRFMEIIDSNSSRFLASVFNADFATRLDVAIESKIAVFEQILIAQNATGSTAQSEFGNPAFLVANAASQTGTKDIVDLAGAIGGVSLAQLQALGVAHVRLVGTNTALELSLGTGADVSGITQDDPTNALDDGFFAQNYTVTLRVTNDQVQQVAAAASQLIAAGIDVLKPVSGSLTLTLAQAESLLDAGFRFSSGLVRFSPTAQESVALDFDQVFRLIDAGLKLSDSITSLVVEIPEGDSRATYSTIQMLASNGVRFSGGEVQLQGQDITRSPYALQFELLEAARSNLTFDLSALPANWALGKSADLAFTFPLMLSAVDAHSLIRAGIPLHDATVMVGSTTEASLVLAEAYDFLAAGVRALDFGGRSISFAQAEAVLEAVAVLRNAGEVFDRPVFQQTVLSGTQGLALSTLNAALSEGLTLPTGFAPDYDQALALVALGSSFPGGLTIKPQAGETLNITSVVDAERLVAAGVRFENVTLTIASGSSADNSFSAPAAEATDLGRLISLARAGLRFVFVGDNATALQTIVGLPATAPVFVSITDAETLLAAGVRFDDATLVVPGAAQFSAIVATGTSGAAGRTAAAWKAAGFDALAITSAVQPTFAQVKATVDAGLTLSAVRVTAEGRFEANTAPITIRIASASEMAGLIPSEQAEKFFQAGIQSIDVLGLPLGLTTVQRFLGSGKPALVNATLVLTTAAEVAAAGDIAYDLFLSGVRSISVAEGVTASAGVWNRFVVARDALESALPGTQFSSAKIFSGGLVSDSQGVNVGVGAVIFKLTEGGLRLSETYQPSKAEVLEFLNASASNRYTKPILLSLGQGESLSLADAELMAGRGVRFASGTMVSLAGVADGAGQAGEQALAAKFLGLLSGGLRLQDFSAGVGVLDSVVVTQTQADILVAGGLRFSQATLVAENATQLTAAVAAIASLATRGIAKIGLATGVSLTFGQAQQIIDAGLTVDAVTRSNTSSPYAVDAGAAITIKATSASQLGAVSPLALKAGGIDVIDLSSIPMSWSAAQGYIGAGLTLQNAVLALTTPEEFSQASAKASQLYDLGFRSMNLGALGVQAADALKFLNVSDGNSGTVDTARDFLFTGGVIIGSQGVLAADLPAALAELRAAGLNPSAQFRPEYQVLGNDPGLGGAEQSNLVFFETLLTKGFRLVFPQSGPEKTLDGVFVTLPQVVRLTSTDAGGISFSQTTVVVDSTARLDALYTHLLSTAGTDAALPAGIQTVGLVGGLTPTLAQALTFAAESLSLERLQPLSGSYASSATQAITVRVGTQSELNALTDLQLRELLETGVTALNISGLTLSLVRAAEIVALNNGLAADFAANPGQLQAPLSVSFVGGSLTLTEAQLADPTNTTTTLAPYTELGLSLPSGVTASGELTLDFALNSYRGSLAQAWVNIGAGPITADQFFALSGRGLASNLSPDVLPQDPIVGSSASQTLLLSGSAIGITANQAQVILQSGIDSVIGETAVLNAVALAAASLSGSPPKQLDLSGLAAVGTTTLARAKVLDARDVGLVKVTVDLEGGVVTASEALALMDEVASERLGAFRNGSLLINQSLTSSDAAALKAVGLMSFRVQPDTLPDDGTLKALGSAGFSLFGSYAPATFAAMISSGLPSSNIDVTQAKVSSLNLQGTIDPGALASVADAVALASTLVKGAKLNLSGVQVSLAGSDAMSLTNATTLLTGTFLGSALPAGQRPFVGTTSNSVLSVTADATTLSPALATQLKQAGISAVSGSLTVAQALAFNGQGFAFQASLASGQTTNFNDAVALSSAIAVPSTAGLSISGLKVTVLTPVALFSSLTLAQKGAQFVSSAGANLSDGRLLVAGNEATTDLSALSNKGFTSFQLASGTTALSATLRDALKLVDTSSQTGIQKLTVSGALTRAQVEALKDHFDFSQATLSSGQTATIAEAKALAGITGLDIKGLVVQASGITSTDRDLLSAKGVQLLNVTIGDKDLTVARALDYANAGLTFTAATLAADQAATAEAAAKLASVAGLSLNGLLANSGPTVAQALVLQAKAVSYAADLGLVSGQQASVAQALSLADVPRLSLVGLRVISGAPTAAEALKLLTEGVVFSGITLAAGQSAAPSDAVLLANAPGLSVSGLVVTGGALSPTQALTLASEGLSLQGKIVEGMASGLTQALDLAKIPGLSLADLTLGVSGVTLDLTAPQALGLLARGVEFANARIVGSAAEVTVSPADAVILSRAGNLSINNLVVAGATLSVQEALVLSADAVSLSGKSLTLGSVATVDQAKSLASVSGLSISGLRVDEPAGGTGSLTRTEALTLVNIEGVVFGARVGLSDAVKTISVAEAIALIKAGLGLSGWSVTGSALTEQFVVLSAENTRLASAQQLPMNLTGLSVIAKPVLDESKTPNFISILEDVAPSLNLGTTIKALIPAGSIRISDGVTTKDIASIALTTVNAVNGTWQYKLASGADWITIDTSSIPVGSALLLAGDDALRFLPKPDFHGLVSVSFAGWAGPGAGGTEQSGTVVSIAGRTSISEKTDLAFLTVSPVNDAPKFDASRVVGETTELEVASAAIVEAVSPTAMTGSGILFFSDPDVSDSHTVEIDVTKFSAKINGEVFANPNMIDFAEAFRRPSLNSQAKSISWAWQGKPQDFDFLTAAQDLELDYVISLRDGAGATVSKTIRISIDGVNDAPTISGPIAVSASEDGDSLSVNALQNARDPDSVLSVVFPDSWAAPSGVAYISQTKTFVLDPKHVAYGGLVAGQSQVVEFDYLVSDGTETASQTIRWTINGVTDFDGVVSDGYVRDAQVFLDLDRDGARDANELGAVSDAQGRFRLLAASTGTATSADGVFVATGGINIDTQLPNDMTLLAPADALSRTLDGRVVVNPLTTLVQLLVQSDTRATTDADAATKVADATAKVRALFGLSGDMDLLSDDPIALAQSGTQAAQETGLAAQKAAVQIVGMATILAADITGSDLSVAERRAAMDAAVKRLAEGLASYSEASAALDFTSGSVLSAVLGQAVSDEAVAKMVGFNTEVQNAQTLSSIAKVQTETFSPALNDPPVNVSASFVSGSAAGTTEITLVFTKPVLLTELANQGSNGEVSALPGAKLALTSLHFYAAEGANDGLTPLDVMQVKGLGTSTLVFTVVGPITPEEVVMVRHFGGIFGVANSQSSGWPASETWIGRSTNDRIDLSGSASMLPVVLRGNAGADLLIGTRSNDTFVDGGGADTLEGGAGSDIFVLGESDGFSRDVIRIGLGHSVVGENGTRRDIIRPAVTAATTSGFDITSAAITSHDALDLPSRQITANTSGFVSGLPNSNTGREITISKHSIASGVVSFQDAAGNALLINTAQRSTDAINYLRDNSFAPGSTLAVRYDRDANGLADSFLVFQAGGTLSAGVSSLVKLRDTLIYIRDMKGADHAVLGTSPGMNVVEITDTQAPEPIAFAIVGNSVVFNFAESVFVPTTGLALSLKRNGAEDLGSLTVSGSGTTTLTASLSSTTSALVATDWVLLNYSGTSEANGIVDQTKNVMRPPANWGGVVIGSAGDNNINLSSASNYPATLKFDLNGFDGRDTIVGSGGENAISGGRGADDMTGGGGADWFDFEQGDSPEITISLPSTGGTQPTALPNGTVFNFLNGVDVIRDFSSGEEVSLQPFAAELNNAPGLKPMFYGYGSAVSTMSTISQVPADGKVADQSFYLVQGTYSGTSFTTSSTGPDTLVVYDGSGATNADGTGAVTNTGIVLQGVKPFDLYTYDGGIGRNYSPPPPPADTTEPAILGALYTIGANAATTNEVVLRFSEAVNVIDFGPSVVNGTVTATEGSTLQQLYSLRFKIINPSQSGSSLDDFAGVTQVRGLGTDTLVFVLNQPLDANAIVLVENYSNRYEEGGFVYTSGVMDFSGNVWSRSEVWAGSNTVGDVIDLREYYGVNRPVTLFGNGGSDKLVGTDTNDLLIDGSGADTLVGGPGSDTIVLVEGGVSSVTGTVIPFARDVIRIALGHSVAGSDGTRRDIITPSSTAPTTSGFDILSTVAANNDVLDLPSGVIAADVGITDGVDNSNTERAITISKHSITSGIVTFYDSSNNTLAINSSQKSSDAIWYLQGNNLVAGTTVAFRYDRDNSGTPDSLLIYQEGGKIGAGVTSPIDLRDTLVYIRDLRGVETAVLGNTAGVGVVQITDTQAFWPIAKGLTSSGVTFDFAEPTFAGANLAVSLKRNGVDAMTVTGTQASASSTTLTLLTPTTLSESDWVLFNYTGTTTANGLYDLRNNVLVVDVPPNWGGVAIGSNSANTINLSNTINYPVSLEFDISGMSGNDTITGSAGRNVVTGGRGADDMTGGGGADWFDFEQGDSPEITISLPSTGGTQPTALPNGTVFNFVNGVDVIRDFSSGEEVSLQPFAAELNNAPGLKPMFYGYGSAVSTMSTISQVPADGKVADQSFYLVQGTYSGTSFTTSSTGPDTLVVYDGSGATNADGTGAVTNTGIVLQGVKPFDLYTYDGGIGRNYSPPPPPADSLETTYVGAATQLPYGDDVIGVKLTRGGTGVLGGQLEVVAENLARVNYVMGSSGATGSRHVSFALANDALTNGKQYGVDLYVYDSASGMSRKIDHIVAPLVGTTVSDLGQDLVTKLNAGLSGEGLSFTLVNGVLTASLHATVAQSTFISSSYFDSYESQALLLQEVLSPVNMVETGETTGDIWTVDLGTYSLKNDSVYAVVVQELSSTFEYKSVYVGYGDHSGTVAGLAARLNSIFEGLGYEAPFIATAQGDQLVLTWAYPAYGQRQITFGELVPLRPIQKVDASGVAVVGEYELSRIRVEDALDLFGYQNVGAIRVEARFDGGQPISSGPIVLPEIGVRLLSSQTSLVEGGTAVFTVELSEAVTAASGLQLNWRVEPPSYGGSAASASDFVLSEGVITIAQGAKTGQITLTAVADGVPELNAEGFRLVVGHNEPTDPAKLSDLSKLKFVKDAETFGTIAADASPTVQTTYLGAGTQLPYGDDVIGVKVKGGTSEVGVDGGDLSVVADLLSWSSSIDGVTTGTQSVFSLTTTSLTAGKQYGIEVYLNDSAGGASNQNLTFISAPLVGMSLADLANDLVVKLNAGLGSKGLSISFANNALVVALADTASSTISMGGAYLDTYQSTSSPLQEVVQTSQDEVVLDAPELSVQLGFVPASTGGSGSWSATVTPGTASADGYGYLDGIDSIELTVRAITVDPTSGVISVASNTLPTIFLNKSSSYSSLWQISNPEAFSGLPTSNLVGLHYSYKGYEIQANNAKVAVPGSEFSSVFKLVPQSNFNDLSVTISKSGYGTEPWATNVYVPTEISSLVQGIGLRLTPILADGTVEPFGDFLLTQTNNQWSLSEQVRAFLKQLSPAVVGLTVDYRAFSSLDTANLGGSTPLGDQTVNESVIKTSGMSFTSISPVEYRSIDLEGYTLSDDASYAILATGLSYGPNPTTVYPVSQISSETMEGLVQALNQRLLQLSAPFSVQHQGTKLILALTSPGHKDVDFSFGELVPLRPIQKVDASGVAVVGEYELSRIRVEDALDLFGYQNVGAIRVEARFDGGQPISSGPIVLPEIGVRLLSSQTSLVEGGTAVFTVELSEAVTAASGLQLNWRVEPPSYGGSAASASDFVLSEGVITIAQGAKTGQITLTAVADGVPELNAEGFRLVVGHNEPTDPAKLSDLSKLKFVKDAEAFGTIAADASPTVQSTYMGGGTQLSNEDGTSTQTIVA